MSITQQPINLKFSDTEYSQGLNESAEWVSKAWKTSLSETQLTKFDNCSNNPIVLPPPGVEISTATQNQIVASKGIAADMIKKKWQANYDKFVKAGLPGVTSQLGYNFYDLRPPVFFLFPVNVPFRNMIPRSGKVNAGYGTAAHWMATKNPGYGNYIGVSEGLRNAYTTPDQNSYVATYKELGVEDAVTFTAQFAGEGFTDELADEHLRGLYKLWLAEEGLMLLGNSGSASGNNGLPLGTCPTPTITRNTVSTGGFANSTSVSVSCVLLTGMGYPSNSQYGYGGIPTVTTGLSPIFNRVGADGSLQAINGGSSAISAMSSVVTCDSTHQTATAKVTGYPNGTYGFAWYVNTTDASSPTLANATLGVITRTPFVTITAAATGTQTGAAVNLNADHSYNTLDFDGLLTYAAATPGAYWNDLGANFNAGTVSNTSLTSGKNGRVNEIETALETIFQNYQVTPDEIWGDPTAITCLDQAIRYSGSNASGYQFVVNRDGMNNILGGFVVSAYQSRYAVNSATGSTALPIKIHPMLPPGTLFFHFKNNPWATSRLTSVVDMLVQRDYYSIEWPLTQRQWTFGTYVHEVMRHTVPWLMGTITGIGTFVGN